ncbi:MAG TPA: hypothetical protein VFU64_06320 [Gaiellaceae bacterium]|nr:hypothetical protein [Gaiellaceae bacterium]
MLDEERSRVRRTILAAVCATVTLVASACGASSSRTEILRLRSANPLSSNIYVKITGPAGAVDYITQRLTAAAFKKEDVGVFVPPSRHPRALCSFTHTIRPTDAPDLQRWRGKKMRIAAYGSAGPLCLVLRSGIYRASS